MVTLEQEKHKDDEDDVVDEIQGHSVTVLAWR